MIDVIINASKEDEKIERENILFAYKYEKGIVQAGGVLISKKGKETL